MIPSVGGDRPCCVQISSCGGDRNPPPPEPPKCPGSSFAAAMIASVLALAEHEGVLDRIGLFGVVLGAHGARARQAASGSSAGPAG